jgi:glycosyltransferase involved in cell wall biosynthesis
MRILYDHQVSSLQDAGGASRYFYQLVRWLLTAPDVEVELWLGINGSIYPFREVPRARVLGWKGSLPRGYRRYIANELLSNVLAPFAGTKDIYHFTLYRSMPMLRSRSRVATHHDCTHERFPQLFPNAGQIIRAKRRGFATADAIICISKSSQADLLRFYAVDAAKTRVIYHGVEPLHGSAEAALAWRKQAASPYLLFVGSRATYKNFGILLQAFRDSGLYKSMWLAAAGGGPLTPAEQHLAKKLEVADRLQVFPQLSDALLAEAYAGANLLVYPSRCEGFGHPPLEAMAAGCPVLVANTSCLPEVCGDAPFYFEPDDPASLERMLLEATNHESARQIARERGARIVSRYSWKQCAAETLALYRDCL